MAARTARTTRSGKRSRFSALPPCSSARAFVLVAAGRAGLHSLLPLGWKASIDKVMDLLRFWKDEARDAKVRLELLEAFMSSAL
jgi:hypothetical protein